MVAAKVQRIATIHYFRYAQGLSKQRVKDNVIYKMAWWLKSAGALNFALSQEQCPISL